MENISLKGLNTFGIDVLASRYVEINSVSALEEILSDEKLKGEKKLILGGGSNVLFTKNFDGLVMHVSLKGISFQDAGDHVFCKAAAGEVWHDVVMKSLELGLYGLENLSLIPGSVGAAPIQNIGAYGVELKDIFHQLEAFHLEDKVIKVFDREECAFGYRDSCFKREQKGKWMILSVTMKLSKQGIVKTSYGAIQEVLAEQKIVDAGPREVSNAVISIRKSKLPDPKDLGNAGSFFKNPEIPKELYQKLTVEWPDMPSYPATPSLVKIPAAYLIEKCNWKGKQIGNVGSHSKQPLVLVNYGGASGEEVKQLAFEIIDSVFLKFGVRLEPEVNFV